MNLSFTMLYLEIKGLEAWLPRGRVSDSELRGPEFDPLWGHCWRLSTDSYIPIKLLYFGSKSYIFKHLLYSYKFSYILKIFPIFLGKFVADEYLVNYI